MPYQLMERFYLAVQLLQKLDRRYYQHGIRYAVVSTMHHTSRFRRLLLRVMGYYHILNNIWEFLSHFPSQHTLQLCAHHCIIQLSFF